jgi:hypothetical protein
MIQCAASISMPDGLGNPRKSDGGVRVTQCTEHRTHPGQRRPPSGGLQPAQGRKLALTSPYLYVHTYLPGYTAPSQFHSAVPRQFPGFPPGTPPPRLALPRPSPGLPPALRSPVPSESCPSGPFSPGATLANNLLVSRVMLRPRGTARHTCDVSVRSIPPVPARYCHGLS